MQMISVRSRPTKRLLLALARTTTVLAAAASLSGATPVDTAWSAAANMGSAVNTTAAETNPALSPDGPSL